MKSVSNTAFGGRHPRCCRRFLLRLVWPEVAIYVTHSIGGTLVTGSRTLLLPHREPARNRFPLHDCEWEDGGETAVGSDSRFSFHQCHVPHLAQPWLWRIIAASLAFARSPGNYVRHSNQPEACTRWFTSNRFASDPTFR